MPRALRPGEEGLLRTSSGNLGLAPAPIEWGTSEEGTCCGWRRRHARKFLQCPLLLPVIWAICIPLIWIMEGFDAQDTCKNSNPAPSGSCHNALDMNATRESEPYRACHILLELPEYTCEKDFCPTCSTGAHSQQPAQNVLDRVVFNCVGVHGLRDSVERVQLGV